MQLWELHISLNEALLDLMVSDGQMLVNFTKEHQCAFAISFKKLFKPPVYERLRQTHPHAKLPAVHSEVPRFLSCTHRDQVPKSTVYTSYRLKKKKKKKS